MTDALTFTTTLSGNVDPTLVFGGPSGSLKLSQLGTNLLGSRIDTHGLTVGLKAAGAVSGKTEKETVLVAKDGTKVFLKSTTKAPLSTGKIDECLPDTAKTKAKKPKKRQVPGVTMKSADRRTAQSPGLFIYRQPDTAEVDENREILENFIQRQEIERAVDQGNTIVQ